MNVLKDNDKFDKLIKVPINYCEKTLDIPKKINDFIVDKSNSIPLFDEENHKYYCSKCLKEITRHNKCCKCLKNLELDKKFNIENIKRIRDYRNNIYYYVFSIVEDDILLYLIHETINYNNPLVYYPFKISEINIENAYQVLPSGIRDIKNNKYISYKKLEDVYMKFETQAEEINDEEFDIYDKFVLNSYEYQYLYVDNLDELKYTKLYKYSNIWDLKDYFNYNFFNLASLIYYPVYYKEFEYLVKLKLYKLAINSCNLFKYKGSFKNNFGVEKKYFSFMKDIDISYIQLEALRLYPTTDLNILNFITDNFELVELILKYVSFDKLLDYFKEQNLKLANLHEYGDYVRCCERMKLNLKDTRILFPKYFIEEHNKITNEMIITNNPKIDEDIKNLSNIFRLNKYEDDKYVIFPANSVISLIDESSQQANCVRTYCEMVSNNECQIYFMRYKNDLNRSFVTIEVRNGKVVQAKTKYNEEPSFEIMRIIKEWEETLLVIDNM